MYKIANVPTRTNDTGTRKRRLIPEPRHPEDLDLFISIISVIINGSTAHCWAVAIFSIS
jgi:hypothetical protein